MNEKKLALRTVALGLTAMFGLYWIYSILLSDRLPIATNANKLIGLLVLYGAGLGLFLLIIRPLPHSEIPKGRVPFSNLLVCFLLQFTALMAMSLLAMAITKFTGKTSDTEINVLKPANLFLLLVFNPIAEEFVFRKLFADKLLRHGQRLFIFASAFCFAIVHSVSIGIPQVLYTFLLGLIWAYLYVRTGKLWVPIVLHALSNLFGGILPSIVQDISETALGMYSMGMMLLAVAGLISFLVMKKQFRFDEPSGKAAAVRDTCLNPGIILYAALTIGMFVLKNTMVR